MARELVFIVDDDRTASTLLARTLERAWGYEARTFESGEACLEALGEDPGLVILDIMLGGMSGVDTLQEIRKRDPDLPVFMLSSQSEIAVAVETMKLGASEYFTKPVDLARLEFAVRNALRMSSLADRVRQLQDTLERTVSFDNIITQSGAMQHALKLVDKARNSDITVLVEGESGTGKELIARAIHFNGKRKDRPFVVINCAAIPRDLLESELFGHEKGAFTGAVDRKIGRFEQADTGTIFLDEIGELDQSLQAKFLRVIQSRTFERVGGTQSITCDVRIISATNRDLRAMSTAGTFREDLYYRLATFPILLPPLRERPTEIPVLAEHFLTMYAGKEGRGRMRFAPGVMRVLSAHAWPGNVRELASTIERAVLLAEGDEIGMEELPMVLHGLREAAPPGVTSLAWSDPDDVIPLESIKEMAVRAALRATEGRPGEAARRLDIGRTTMYELMKKYGLE